MSHKQILVQVRAMVDEGIVELVKTLNQIPDVFTISSCEGAEDRNAYVTFILHDTGSGLDLLKANERPASAKALFLLQNLTELFGDQSGVEVNLRWKYGGPTFNLILPNSKIKEVAKRIRDGIKAVAKEK
jgi:hypothetical protein